MPQTAVCSRVVTSSWVMGAWLLPNQHFNQFGKANHVAQYSKPFAADTFLHQITWNFMFHGPSAYPLLFSHQFWHHFIFLVNFFDQFPVICAELISPPKFGKVWWTSGEGRWTPVEYGDLQQGTANLSGVRWTLSDVSVLWHLTMYFRGPDWSLTNTLVIHWLPPKFSGWWHPNKVQILHDCVWRHWYALKIHWLHLCTYVFRGLSSKHHLLPKKAICGITLAHTLFCFLYVHLPARCCKNYFRLLLRCIPMVSKNITCPGS